MKEPKNKPVCAETSLTSDQPDVTSNIVGYANWAVQAGVDKIAKRLGGAGQHLRLRDAKWKLFIHELLSEFQQMEGDQRVDHFIQSFRDDPDLEAGRLAFNRLVAHHRGMLEEALKEAWSRKLQSLEDSAASEHSNDVRHSDHKPELAKKLFRDVILVDVERYPAWQAAGHNWAQKYDVASPYNIVRFRQGDDLSTFAKLTDDDHSKLKANGALLLKPKVDGNA